MPQNSALPTIIIYLDPTEPEPFPVPPDLSEDAKRVRFWRRTAVINNADYSEPEIKSLESRITTFFPRALEKKLRQELLLAKRLSRRRGATDDSDADPLSTYFAFEVVRFSYNSLDLTLSIDGLDGLFRLFDGDLELFADVLQQYSPAVFAGVLGSLSKSPAPVSARLPKTDELESPFSHARLAATESEAPVPQTAHVHTGDTEATPRKTRFLRAVWALSNTSLIVPTLLALIVLYFSTKSLDAEKEILQKRSAELHSLETALLESSAAREKALFSAIASMMEQKASSKNISAPNPASSPQ